MPIRPSPRIASSRAKAKSNRLKSGDFRVGPHISLYTTPSREVHGRLWDHDFAPRNPQRISAKEMRPGGPDEYAKTLIVFSWKTVPCAVPAPSGMVSLPALQMAAS